MSTQEESRQVVASGDRGIAVGGDAINSLLVTGDGNTFFIGRYERLIDAYLSPSALYQELDTFTGREWLVTAIDRFIRGNDRGYLIVEADAGMGKSAFLAWLARSRGYPHHFVRLMPDPQDVAVAVRNLSSQLIRAWDLETLAVGGVLPPSAGRPDFLRDLLSEVAARRDELRPGEPIVLVVDGLNETVVAPGQNPLGLPASLPAGVYVVASQRPVRVALRIDVPRIVLGIAADSEGNMRDVRDYLRTMARSPELAPRLSAAGVPAETFVEILLARSGGVWIYLHYVLAEIGRGRRSPADVALLPTGLWHYYAQYWYEWQHRHEDQWFRLHLPVLATLAAIGEPLPARSLAELTGASAGVIEDLLEDDWRPFVQVEEGEEENRYRTFHDSLREFLHGDVDAEELATAERLSANRLARATRAAHSRIADRYLDAWGGISAGLPVLSEGAAADLDGGYGLRHLIEHLDLAGRSADMQAVLRLSWPDGARRVNTWFAVHRRTGQLEGYRRDVTTAWNAARLGSGRQDTAELLRGALILSSLNSMAATTPPVLWPVLVRKGKLTPAESFAWARQIPVPEERAETLTRLIEVVPGDLRGEAEREALAAVRAVPDGYWRLGELCRLHPVISDELRGDMRAVIRSLADEFYRLVAVRMLDLDEDPVVAPVRRGPGLNQASARHENWQAGARFVEEYLRRRNYAADLLRQAGLDVLAAAPLGPASPAERYWRTHLLAFALSDATGTEADRLAAAAVEMGETIGDRRDAVAAWAAYGRAFDMAGTSGADLLEAVGGISEPAYRAAIAIITSQGESIGTIAAALAEVEGEEHREELLVTAAPALTRLGAEGIRSVTALLADSRSRAETLLAAAENAAPAVAERIVTGLLADLTAASGVVGHAGLLSRTAAHLPSAALARLKDAAARLADSDAQSTVLAAAGVRHCLLGEIEQAVQVLEVVDGPSRPALALEVARAQARHGDPTAALRLAEALPYTAWRAEILALASNRLDSASGNAAVRALSTLLGDADGAVRAPVLARAAMLVPVRHRASVIRDAAAAAEELEEDSERALALLSVVAALAANGDIARALRTCDEIPVERLRARALTLVFPVAGVLEREEVTRRVDALADGQARARARMENLASRGDGPGTEVAIRFEAAVRDLMTRPRHELLQNMPGLLEVVVRLDGRKGLLAAAAALRDVLEWWP